MCIGLLRLGKEIRGKGYRRHSLKNMSWEIYPDNSCVMFRTKKVIRFGMARSAWGWVTGFGLFTGKERGRLLRRIWLTESKDIVKGASVHVGIGNLELGVQGDL